jgi:hypothetical protein
LVSALLLPTTVTLAQEVTEPAAEESPTLGIDASATYTSKYIWRGYDLFDDHAAFQPSATLDLFDTGFSVNVWGSIPCGTGSNNQAGGINQWQEYDYTLAYGTTLFEEEIYAVDASVYYIYYDFPKLNHMADTQEVAVGLAMPALVKIGEQAIVPSYYVGKLWPTSSSVPDVAGWYHTLGLSTDVAIPQTDLALTLKWDINYNDGMFTADHDWTHTTFGISTSVPVGPVAVSPFLSYQVSMDDSVNPEDEFWGGVTVAMSF